MAKIKLEYKWIDARGARRSSFHKEVANNDAYYNDSAVEVFHKGKLVDKFRPTKLDLSNTDTFHNPITRKNNA